jgi:hypothetical protein
MPRWSADRRAPCVTGRGMPRHGVSTCRVMARFKVRRSAPALLGALPPRVCEGLFGGASPCASRPAAKPAAKRAGGALVATSGALAVVRGEACSARRAPPSGGGSIRRERPSNVVRPLQNFRLHPGCEELHPACEDPSFASREQPCRQAADMLEKTAAIDYAHGIGGPDIR